MFYSHTHHYCCNWGFCCSLFWDVQRRPLIFAVQHSREVKCPLLWRWSTHCPSYRRMVDLEDELSDIPSDSVPSEVRNWLASTFTRQKGLKVRCNEDKLRFRSIVHVVQAGIFVDRSVSLYLHFVKWSDLVSLDSQAVYLDILLDISHEHKSPDLSIWFTVAFRVFISSSWHVGLSKLDSKVL